MIKFVPHDPLGFILASPTLLKVFLGRNDSKFPSNVCAGGIRIGSYWEAVWVEVVVVAVAVLIVIGSLDSSRLEVGSVRLGSLIRYVLRRSDKPEIRIRSHAG